MKIIESKQVPDLRFANFTMPWEKIRLGDVANFSKGKGISKSDIHESGAIECIRYGELYTTYGVLINQIKSRTNITIGQLVISEGNEVLIPASGEDALEIATAAVVEKSGIALGSDLNIIRSTLDGIFLAYYLRNKKKIDIAKLAQGNSVVHLYSSQLSTLHLFHPHKDEQRKIAKFLVAIDDKLSNLYRKCELLKIYKFGLMQKILNREVRFKRDNGSNFSGWEEKSLRELANKSTEKNIDGTISRVLTNSATQGVLDQQDYFDKNIANANNLDGYYIIEKGDYVYNPRISAHAPVGPINKNKIGRGLMSPLYLIFRFKNEENIFYEYYFQTKSWHKYMCSVANYGARHDRMNISNSDFMDMPVPCPHPEEQAKIVAALSVFEMKLTALTMQISKLETFKKGLLQKMFI